MRKPFIWLLLAAALCGLLSAAAAEAPEKAEQSVNVMGAFTVSAEIPQGYAFKGNYVSDILYYGTLTPEDPAYPVAIITIAFDEEADGRSIGDLTEEQIFGMVAQDAAALGEHVEFSEAETAHGTKLLVYNILDEEEARFEIYPLYRGYQIGCVLLPGQGQTMTQELLKTAVDFLSNVWITE